MDPTAAAKDDRQTEYKNAGKGADANRERRRELTVELRKTKREDFAGKHRKIGGGGDDDVPMQDAQLQKTREHEIFAAIIHTLRGNMTIEQLKTALQVTRQILTRSSAPIQQFVDSGLVPMMVELTRSSHSSDIVLEATWVLTNVCAGTTLQTGAVVQAGAVPEMVRLLHSPDTALRDQAIWALANIAGDGPLHRSAVMQAGAMEVFIGLLHQPQSLEVSRMLVWAISNMCRYYERSPPAERMSLVLPVILRILRVCQDIEMIRHACWAVAYMTSSQPSQARIVVQAGIVVSAVNLVSCTGTEMMLPVARLISNIASYADDDMTDVVMSSGAAVMLRSMMQCKEEVTMREACAATAALLMGTSKHRQHVLQSRLLYTVFEVGADPSETFLLRTAVGAVVSTLVTRYNSTAEDIAFALGAGAMNIALDILAASSNVIDESTRREQLAVIEALFSLPAQAAVIDTFNWLEGPAILDKQICNHHLSPSTHAIVERLMSSYLHVDTLEMMGDGMQTDTVATFDFTDQGAGLAGGQIEWPAI